MKTNIFRVKEKKEKRIIIEEERTKNPLLLFWRRHRNFFMLLFLTLLFCTFLISVGLAFSLFRGSNDYDVSYINGGEEIDSNNDPNIDDDDIKEELLGEVARSEGVVVLVEMFTSNQGDVVYYYTDGTSVVVQSNGKIYRVSPKANGNYGVDRNGKFADTAKKILVTSTTSTLMDGTVITYYSDGTAKIELKQETIFVRDSNNIKLDGGVNFAYTNPSGVALSKEFNKINNTRVTTFTDGTSLIQQGDRKFIVNKNTPVAVTDDGVNYDKNNTFSVIGEQTLSDGNVVTHYANGSAVITQPNGNVIYVKKAGDIVVKNEKLYEIITNEYGFSRSVVNCPDGKQVIYYDNGAAVIIYPNGNRQYVADNMEIIYDNNKNISSMPTTSILISQKKTSDGKEVYNFDNGKSQVINQDGSSYIVDTSKLTFLPSGEITGEPVDVDNNSGAPGEGDGDGSGSGHEVNEPTDIYISKAENRYNDFKNIEDTVFIIRNNNRRTKRLRIAIQEVLDYQKYNTRRLEPSYVKFQATVGDEYVTARSLTSNIWRDSDDKLNYVIYDGNISAKTTVTVALSLYVDYAELTNFHQDRGFIGTIHIYVNE